MGLRTLPSSNSIGGGEQKEAEPSFKKKEIKDDEWKILLGLSNGSAALTPRRIIVELATRVLSGTAITTILSRALFGGAGVSIGALRLNVVVVRFLRGNLSPDELRINV